MEFFDGYKHVDLFLPEAKINVEVDGDQHLINAEQIIRDFSREYYSERAGYHTLHIPNAEALSYCEKIADALKEIVLMCKLKKLSTQKLSS